MIAEVFNPLEGKEHSSDLDNATLFTKRECLKAEVAAPRSELADLRKKNHDFVHKARQIDHSFHCQISNMHQYIWQQQRSIAEREAILKKQSEQLTRLIGAPGMKVLRAQAPASHFRLQAAPKPSKSRSSRESVRAVVGGVEPRRCK